MRQKKSISFFGLILGLMLLVGTVPVQTVHAASGKWMSNSSGWWYQYADGSYENSGFCGIGNDTYYFDSNGYMRTGWLLTNGAWYYFDGSGHMVTGWNWIDDNCYYFAEDGIMAADTYIGDSYVDSSGVWREPEWKYDSAAGKYWYQYADGTYPASSLIGIGDQYYSFDKDGYMYTGWFYDEYLESWLYFQENGVMALDGWYWIENNCYYFYDYGYMAADTYIDGSYVDPSGIWRPDQWVYDSAVGKYWYRYSEGTYPANVITQIGDKFYRFDSDGYMCTGWYYDEEIRQWYYFQEDGAMQRDGWCKIGDDWYYFYEMGYMARETFIDGIDISPTGQMIK